MLWDCIIVGGGFAGLQAAIMLGRNDHKVLVVDAGYGRSILCRQYHNILGWPDGVSGEELRKIGRKQAESFGVRFMADEVVGVMKLGEGNNVEFGGFELKLRNDTNTHPQCKTLLLATGLLDRFPPLPGLVQCLGLTVYVCPDCDGYEVRHRRTLVMGTGEVGAAMALTLSDRTNDIVYINHEKHILKPETLQKLQNQGINYREEAIERIIAEPESQFEGIKLENGETIFGERGFIAFGGNEIRSQLAEQLGIERLENKHIVADPRTKMTSLVNVWAAGDVGVHAEQVTIAMGEGSQSAIWIHKALKKMG